MISSCALNHHLCPCRADPHLRDHPTQRSGAGQTYQLEAASPCGSMHFGSAFLPCATVYKTPAVCPCYGGWQAIPASGQCETGDKEASCQCKGLEGGKCHSPSQLPARLDYAKLFVGPLNGLNGSPSLPTAI